MRNRLNLSAQTINDVVFHVVSTYGLINEVKGLLQNTRLIKYSTIFHRGRRSLVVVISFCSILARARERRKGEVAIRTIERIETKGWCGVDPYLSHPLDNLFHSKSVTRPRRGHLCRRSRSRGCRGSFRGVDPCVCILIAAVTIDFVTKII